MILKIFSKKVDSGDHLRFSRKLFINKPDMKMNYPSKAFALPAVLLLFFLILFLSEKSTGQSANKSAGISSIPESVQKIFDKSCISCHADGGKMLAMNHVNFSKWEKYTPEKKASKASDICKMVSSGKMPPKSFRESKPDLIPTSDQIKNICSWSESFPKDSKK
jgi:hypothetical protein